MAVLRYKDNTLYLHLFLVCSSADMGIIRPDPACIVLQSGPHNVLTVWRKNTAAFTRPAILLLKSIQPMSLCLTPWGPHWTATWRRKGLSPVRTPELSSCWTTAPEVSCPGVHKRQQSLSPPSRFSLDACRSVWTLDWCGGGSTRDAGEPDAVVTIHIHIIQRRTQLLAVILWAVCASGWYYES